MRVFDFSNQTEEKVNPECTYTTFRSNEEISTPEHPIFVLDNKKKSMRIIPLDFLQIRQREQHLNLKRKIQKNPIPLIF